MSLPVITIETRLGAKYVFPDVVDIEWARNTPPSPYPSSDLSTFTFVNESGACLVLPRRIVKVIYVDDEKKVEFP